MLHGEIGIEVVLFGRMFCGKRNETLSLAFPELGVEARHYTI